MASGNWIKLNRKIWDNFIWSFEKPKYALAWIDILLLANYKDKSIMFDGKVEVIQRGTFITSMVKLAARWDMNRETVKRFLDLLQSEGMITYTPSKRRTVINVVNYEVFQDFVDADPATEPTTDPATEPTTDPATEPAQHKKTEEGQKGQKGQKGLIVSYETITEADVQRVIEEWNKLGLSKILKVVPNTKRHTLLCDRVKEYGLDMVLEAIRKVGQNDFLKGGGENGWKATFDWLMQDEKFTNVLGGVYDRKPQTSSSGSGRKEMVPEWMKNDRANNRAKEDLERTKKVLAEMERENRRLEGEQKPTTGTDPDLAARAEKLRKSLGTGKDGEPNANRQEN